MSKTKLLRNQTVLTFHSQKPIISFFFSIIFPAKLPIWMGKLLVEGTRRGSKGQTIWVALMLCIALGHQQAIVLQQEWVDPLCRYMMMCCSPIECLDHNEVVSFDGHGYDWEIYGLMKSYTESIKKRPAVNRAIEIRDNFNHMQGYRWRPDSSPKMSTLPLYLSASSRQDAIWLNGYKGLLALTQKANGYQPLEEEEAEEEI